MKIVALPNPETKQILIYRHNLVPISDIFKEHSQEKPEISKKLLRIHKNERVSGM